MCIFICIVWYPRWQLNERRRTEWDKQHFCHLHWLWKAIYRHFSCLVMKKELSDNITSYQHHPTEPKRWRVTLTLFIRLAQILRYSHNRKFGNVFFHKLPKTVQLSLVKMNQNQLFSFFFWVKHLMCFSTTSKNKLEIFLNCFLISKKVVCSVNRSCFMLK